MPAAASAQSKRVALHWWGQLPACCPGTLKYRRDAPLAKRCAVDGLFMTVIGMCSRTLGCSTCGGSQCLGCCRACVPVPRQRLCSIAAGVTGAATSTRTPVCITCRSCRVSSLQPRHTMQSVARSPIAAPGTQALWRWKPEQVPQASIVSTFNGHPTKMEKCETPCIQED